jgi:hypothetical protein
VEILEKRSPTAFIPVPGAEAMQSEEEVSIKLNVIGQGGEMNQALYAHMNNKRKMKINK